MWFPCPVESVCGALSSSLSGFGLCPSPGWVRGLFSDALVNSRKWSRETAAFAEPGNLLYQ